MMSYPPSEATLANTTRLPVSDAIKFSMADRVHRLSSAASNRWETSSSREFFLSEDEDEREFITPSNSYDSHVDFQVSPLVLPQQVWRHFCKHFVEFISRRQKRIGF